MLRFYYVMQKKIKENSILESKALYTDMCMPSFRMDLMPPSLG